MSFVAALPVRFQDCDPAGIAYFPRLLALVDAAIEDWTADALGTSRAEMHLEMGLGLPTVDLRTRFRAPARLGDVLELAVTVAALGRTSLTLAVTSPALDARLVLVLTDLAAMRATAWADAPRNWRARLETLLSSAARAA
jgi:4-hydroxybenzoyl-CoA thioesterase